MELTSRLKSAIESGSQDPISTPKFTLKKYDFHSLYDDFEEAMNEAESYYDTENGYKEFKAKHSALFFAEQPEDYSAYLPVSNRTVAKFLNVNGEVEIAGTVVDLRDITSYQQLVDKSLIPKEQNLINLKSTVNRLDDVHCNDRKLWVNAWARPGQTPIGLDKIVEVGFRKKGFLGAWYNYSSETTLGWTNTNIYWSKSGYSSHDYIFAAAVSGGFKGNMWVKFRGFGSECGDTKYYFDVSL